LSRNRIREAHSTKTFLFLFLRIRSYFCESANACADECAHTRPDMTGLLFLLFCDSPSESSTCAPETCDSVAIRAAIRHANVLQPLRDRGATLGLSPPIPCDSRQRFARKSLILRPPRGRASCRRWYRGRWRPGAGTAHACAWRSLSVPAAGCHILPFPARRKKPCQPANSAGNRAVVRVSACLAWLARAVHGRV